MKEHPIDVEACERLEIIRSELERQLEDNLARQNLLVTRGLVLVGAAGVSLGLWGSINGHVGTLGIVLAVVAAGLGVASLWLWRSPAPVLVPALLDLYMSADRYSVLHAFVRDLSATVKQRVEDARLKARFVTLGFVVIVVSWLLLVVDGIVN